MHAGCGFFKPYHKLQIITSYTSHCVEARSKHGIFEALDVPVLAQHINVPAYFCRCSRACIRVVPMNRTLRSLTRWSCARKLSTRWWVVEDSNRFQVDACAWGKLRPRQNFHLCNFIQWYILKRVFILCFHTSYVTLFSGIYLNVCLFFVSIRRRTHAERSRPYRCFRVVEVIDVCE